MRDLIRKILISAACAAPVEDICSQLSCDDIQKIQEGSLSDLLQKGPRPDYDDCDFSSLSEACENFFQVDFFINFQSCRRRKLNLTLSKKTR